MTARREINRAVINSNPNKPYTMTWLIRSGLYAELRWRGITLYVNKNITIKEFSSSFPVSCAWANAFAHATSDHTRYRDTNAMNVKMLRVTHPIEMLTCFLCSFGSEGVLSTTTDYLEAHCEALRDHRMKYNAESLVEKASIDFARLL